MALGWSVVDSKDIAALVAALRRMQRNAGAAIPPLSGPLARVSESLDDLRIAFSRSTDELYNQSKQLSETLNRLPDAVLVVEKSTVVFLNKSAVRMFGLKRVTVGTALDDVRLPALVKSVIENGIESGKNLNVELAPDPTGRSLSVRHVFIKDTGGNSSSLFLVSDITERVRLESARRDFVTAASHELKTPVAGIELTAATARLAIEDGNTQAALQFLDNLSDATKTLNRMVNDLLDLSRFEEAPNNKEVSDVRAAVSTTLFAHKGTAEARGISLTSDFSRVSKQDIFAAISSTDLIVILDNLVSNAIAYVDEGSVSVIVRAGSKNVKILVRDTGIGIRPDQTTRIFERFYRVDKSRSRESGGTGLGLSLVSHAVMRAGGKISVDSTPGVGSTFTVSIPRVF